MKTKNNRQHIQRKPSGILVRTLSKNVNYLLLAWTNELIITEQEHKSVGKWFQSVVKGPRFATYSKNLSMNYFTVTAPQAADKFSKEQQTLRLSCQWWSFMENLSLVSLSLICQIIYHIILLFLY